MADASGILIPPPLPNERRDSGKSSTILRSKDSRKILIDMGFSRHRAEKALAATGDCGIQIAADWLLSHVFDPDLDKPTPREYIVYACPTGTLDEAIEEFMEAALTHTGRNGAHKSFPHVTLCQFFKCDDGLNPYVLHALNNSFDTYSSKAPREVKLKRFTTQGYIGLFLEEDAASWFRDVMKMFSTECKDHGLGVQVEPHKRQLHITMAHQYPTEHHSKLEELAQSLVEPTLPARWELRLYSRDTRLSTSEIYKVLYPYTPRKEDELELIEDDFVFVSIADQGQTESEGWYFGRSFMTGFSGLYPGNYVEKAKDSDCWTLHKSWTVSNVEDDKTERRPSLETVAKSVAKSRNSTFRREDQQLYDNAVGLLPDRKNVEELYAKVEPKKNRKSHDSNSNPNSVSPDSDSPPALPQGPRRLFIFRHAERVDVTFGKQWIQLSFDSEGYYHRRNLNMPKELPKRRGGPQDFTRDSPITELGLFQARLTGEGMREQGIKIHNVISSPAIRCVQTSNAILQGMGDFNTKIKVEHGLFEWLAWCRGEIPKFLEADDMAKFGLQVDPSYTPLVSIKDLKPNETHLEFYKRMYNITRLLLKNLGPNSGNIMIVGHAATLEACTRQLIGGQPRNPQDLTKLVQKIPYCGVCVCQESGSGRSSTWDFIDPPVPPLTHAPNIRFDWRCLQ